MSANPNNGESAAIRPAHVAGMFYPGDRKILLRLLDELFQEATGPEISGEVVGLISPHAGYRYSGLTAAHGFSTLKMNRYDSVVILSPSHHEYFKGISIFPGNGYDTPLGTFPLDADLRNAIVKSGKGLVNISNTGHGQEHAIEVQLPFLYRALRVVPIVPIVMGDQGRRYCQALGRLLGEVLKNRRVLLVASSDLSHFHIAEEADRIDQVFINDVIQFNEEQVMADLDEGKTEACGGGPAAAMMIACRILGASSARILHHSNSGVTTGDFSQVVGYLSAVILREN